VYNLNKAVRQLLTGRDVKNVIVQLLQNDNYHHDGMCVDLQFTKPGGQEAFIEYQRLNLSNWKDIKL